MNNITQTIIDILENITGASGFEDMLDMDLFEEGILDSLAFLEIVIEVENSCNVHIEPSEVERADMNTVSKISNYIQERSNEKSA